MYSLGAESDLGYFPPSLLTLNSDLLDFCLLDGEESCREFLIYYAGCASPRLHSAACATILSQGPAG